MEQTRDFFGLDQPMDLITKTKADGSQVIRKLSRNETRQMEMFKKMKSIKGTNPLGIDDSFKNRQS